MNIKILGAASVVIFLLFLSCNSNRKPAVLNGYLTGYSNVNREKKFVIDDLQEISGIFFINDGEKMVSINDEEGKIYTLDFSGKELTTSFTFGKKGDYEDIVMDDKYYYVLEGKGRIHRVPRPGVDDSVVEFRSNIKDADFEAMYIEPENNRIVIICKSCREYEKDKKMPAYCFNLLTNEFEPEPCYTLDISKVRKLLKNNLFASKPSAAAIHPILNKLFIICSQDGRGLLICDRNGNVEEAHYLDDGMFPQPEGITFAPNGDMYISNEGLIQPGSVVRYPYRKN